MIAVLIVNLVAIGLAIVLPNDVLKWHSYIFYGIQLCTLVPYAARRAFFAKNLFMPTLFALCYYLVNLTFGGFLVPRYYGWNKEYGPVTLAIGTYDLIVPYLLMANVILFLVTCWTISVLAHVRSAQVTDASSSDGAPLRRFGWIAEGLCIAVFVVVLLVDFSALALILSIQIVHLSELARRRAPYRYLVYAIYLFALVGFDFENKREIAMSLFLMVFLEGYYGWHVLRLTPRTVLRYAAAGLLFLGLILTSSILRGYGQYEVTSVVGAALVLPRYVSSDIFVDGITDNLELNYNYGAAVNAIDMTSRGELPYQLGASLWKVLFLPIPRSKFPWKPESVMQLYTKIYAPTYWASSGSLPVIFSSEMYVNFAFFGLLPFALVWMALNGAYVALHRSAARSFMYYSSIFLVISILNFARGSGLELYVLYYLYAAPVLLLASLFAGGNRRRGNTATSD